MRGVELFLGEARTAVPLRRPLPRGGSNSSRVWAGGGAAVWAAVSHLGCKRVRLPRMPLQPNALTWARALTQILTRHGALQYPAASPPKRGVHSAGAARAGGFRSRGSSVNRAAWLVVSCR